MTTFAGYASLLIVIAQPTRDRLSERREANRQEVTNAAWEVAREHGLAQMTLRQVATRVGMQPPSLYSHFASKDAIYDAMFRQAWETYEAQTEDLQHRLDGDPRIALNTMAASFVDFALADLPRHQLMNVRMIPGFEPSPESYEPAVRVLDRLRTALLRLGIKDDDAVDLFTALTGGLVDQQWANDPGGDRWRRLLDRAVDMYATEMGVPRPERKTR